MNNNCEVVCDKIFLDVLSTSGKILSLTFTFLNSERSNKDDEPTLTLMIGNTRCKILDYRKQKNTSISMHFAQQGITELYITIM